MQNSYNLVGSETIEPAPAAAIYGDKSVFVECGFVSYQDTLFDAKGRHYFKNCYIEGEVDFIYGNGQSYYEVIFMFYIFYEFIYYFFKILNKFNLFIFSLQDCIVNATLGNSPPGFITAQSRGSEKDQSGFVFRTGCVVGNGKVNLGRAYGPYSRVIFFGTYFSSVISPEGWDAWGYTGQEYCFFHRSNVIML